MSTNNNRDVTRTNRSGIRKAQAYVGRELLAISKMLTQGQKTTETFTFENTTITVTTVRTKELDVQKLLKRLINVLEKFLAVLNKKNQTRKQRQIMRGGGGQNIIMLLTILFFLFNLCSGVSTDVDVFTREHVLSLSTTDLIYKDMETIGSAMKWTLATVFTGAAYALVGFEGFDAQVKNTNVLVDVVTQGEASPNFLSNLTAVVKQVVANNSQRTEFMKDESRLLANVSQPLEPTFCAALYTSRANHTLTPILFETSGTAPNANISDFVNGTLEFCFPSATISMTKDTKINLFKALQNLTNVYNLSNVQAPYNTIGTAFSSANYRLENPIQRYATSRQAIAPSALAKAADIGQPVVPMSTTFTQNVAAPNAPPVAKVRERNLETVANPGPNFEQLYNINQAEYSVRALATMAFALTVISANAEQESGKGLQLVSTEELQAAEKEVSKFIKQNKEQIAQVELAIRAQYPLLQANITQLNKNVQNAICTEIVLMGYNFNEPTPNVLPKLESFVQKQNDEFNLKSETLNN